MSHTIVGDCQVWTGLKNEKGYGVVNPNIYGTRYIHRIVYIDHHGAIPEGKLVLHKCGRASCFNPDHLYAGDKTQNAQDSASDGTHNIVKLTEKEVLEIREEAEAGTSRKDIALMYDVTPSNVSCIVRRRTWKHI